MKMTKKQFDELAKEKSPSSRLCVTLPKAFLIGGLICTLGQAFINLYKFFGLKPDDASTAASVTLIFLSALLTGLGLYSKIARHGGAGTLVPITGFANAVASPSLEFKTEGFILGTAAKMFVIAGPVIVYGLAASVVYGVILCVIRLIGEGL